MAWTEAPATLAPTLAPALPLELRNDAVDVEAPPRGARAAARRAASAGVGLLNMALFQIVLPLLAPLIDLFLRLRAAVPRSGADARRLGRR